MMTYGVFIFRVSILISGLGLVLGGSCNRCGKSSKRDTTSGGVNLVCPHCGHVHNESALYCGRCGKRFEDGTE